MHRMLAGLVLALSPAAAAQSTWYVDVQGVPPGSGTAGDPYTSLDFALAQSSTVSGDLVLVAPGTYAEQVSFHGKGVHVKATGGATSTVLDARGAGSAALVDASGGAVASLEGFTLTGGSGSGSSSTHGGGIYAEGAHLSVIECVVEANEAGAGGGLYLRNCTAELRRCVVRGNAALATFGSSPDGGGIHVSGGTFSLVECMVEGNTAGTPGLPGYGGGVFSSTGVVHSMHSVFRDNRADKGGGGLSVEHGLLEGCQVSDNRGQFGGGIRGGRGLLVSNSRLSGNIATSPTGSNDFGGGVFGPATLVRCALVGNRATGTAGAAYGATLTDCSITGNWATAGSPVGQFPIAGGVFGCTLTRCTLNGNWSSGDGASFLARGGGAANSTLVGCRVWRNEARGSKASGGGLADCDALSSLVYDNRSDGFGGGIHGGSTRRCTVVGNSAATDAGGVLALGPAGTLVENSIVWGNGQEVVVPAGSKATVTYCDVQGGFPGTGNIDLDPQFWDAAARDFHLQATSPCIDAGDPTSAPDPDGSVADMGALPYDPDYAGG